MTSGASPDTAVWSGQAGPAAGPATPMRRDDSFWGPDRAGLCPCGSRRPARTCHGRDDGSWRGARWTLSRRESTGHANPYCNAASLHDCSTRLSYEPYIADAVREAAGCRPVLTLLPLMAYRHGLVTRSAAPAPVWCRRHQTRLAPLDREAVNAFRAMHRFGQLDRSGPPPPGDDFDLIDGHRLEAWLLKTWFGLLAEQPAAAAGAPLAGWRAGAKPVLLDVLFRGRAWPAGWGLWITPPGRTAAAATDPALATFVSGDRCWGASAELGPFPLQLLLGAPADPHASNRPGGLVMLREKADIQKTLLLGWPHGAGTTPVVNTTITTTAGVDRDP